MRHLHRAIVPLAAAISMACNWAAADESVVVQPARVIEYEPNTADDRPPVITAVAVVPGGGMVATAGDDHVVRLWSTTSGQVVHVLETHSDWVRTLAFSPDGATLASGGDDHRIVLWDVATGRELLRTKPHRRPVYALAFSPDGSQLAAVGFEDLVRIYDPTNGKTLRELKGPGVDLRAVVFSPNGSQLATAGRNGTIRVWNTNDYSVAWDTVASRSRIRTLAYLPKGDLLVSAGEARPIPLWDTQTGQRRGELTPQSGKVLSMVVCGEDLIATGGSDNLVRVWNWRSQQEVDRLQGHTGSVATLAYDASSAMMISGSFDTTIRVWKLGSRISAARTDSPAPAEATVR